MRSRHAHYPRFAGPIAAESDAACGGPTIDRASRSAGRTSEELVATASCERPPPDRTEARWRRRPVLAGAIRVVVITTPLAASVCAGIAAGHAYRPVGWLQIVAWVAWTAAVSVTALALIDGVVRRLLPLQRLLQLCLVFPDRAPSRLRVAMRAAGGRRPELWAGADDVPQDTAEAARNIVSLLGALARHDRRTRGHSERVCAYTELLAAQMDLPLADRDRLRWVSLIHDIGKLEVPPRLLNKAARPTTPEWRVLQEHPRHGDRIVAPLRSWLGPWADAVVQHHERFDGLGYPCGLRGQELCLGARIIAVTDAFEVMTAPRAYRRPVDPQSARAELARHAGTQFDPEIVRHFLAVGLPQLRKSMALLSWLGQIPFLRAWPTLQSVPSAAATQAATAGLVVSSAGTLLLVPAEVAPPAAHQPAPSPITHAAAPTQTEAQPQAQMPGQVSVVPAAATTKLTPAPLPAPPVTVSPSPAGPAAPEPTTAPDAAPTPAALGTEAPAVAEPPLPAATDPVPTAPAATSVPTTVDTPTAAPPSAPTAADTPTAAPAPTPAPTPTPTAADTPTAASTPAPSALAMATDGTPAPPATTAAAPATTAGGTPTS